MPSPESAREPVLLVTAAGTAAGYGLLRACGRRFPGVRRVAADINLREYCAASAECDVYVRTCGVAHERFAEEMAEVVRREGVTAYVPILDEEIVWAASFGPAAGLRVAAPSRESAEVCLDKLRTFEVLRARSIPTPDTSLGGTAPPDDGCGLVAKPRRGRGSQGFRVLRATQDALALGADHVVQTKLSPPEVTVDAFRSPAMFRAVCRERIETRTGVCVKARVFSERGLERIVEDVGRALDLRGTYCVQVMRGASDDWQVTDVNPRPGAGTALSAACGVDFLAAHVADVLGRDAAEFLPPLERERCVVRVYQEIVTR